MIKVLIASVGLFVLMTPAVLSHAAFQEYSYTSPKADFTIDLPSGNWRKTGEPDDVHQHTEFIYGDRNDGYLRIRKEAITEGTKIRDFALRDQDERSDSCRALLAAKMILSMVGSTAGRWRTNSPRLESLWQAAVIIFKVTRARFTFLDLPGCVRSSSPFATRPISLRAV